MHNGEMTEAARGAVNAATAAAGEGPRHVAGMAVRRLSLESLNVLEMVGCRLAARFGAALNGRAVTAASPVTLQDLTLFLWAHAAPEDDVLATALACVGGERAAALRAAMLWSRSVPGGLAALEPAMQAVTADQVAVEAAAGFEAHSPYDGHGGGAKKNG